MNWKAWAPLAVAVVLGLVAAVTARNLVSRRPAQGASAAAGPQVVVVKQNVLPGQALRQEDLATMPLAWKELPAGTFQNPAELVGRVTTMPLVKGQPVLEALLAPPGAGAGLQALVPEGMRAITIEVNEISGVAGLVSPGCAVDVVATVEDPKSKERLGKTIVQDVKVMAVGQHVASGALAGRDAAASSGGAPPEPIKSVTLLTTPQEAEALELASMIGRPRLVLRGNGDTAAARSDGVTVEQLCTGRSDSAADLLAPALSVAADRPVPTTRPAAEVRIVKVIKGGVESSVAVPLERSATVPPAEVLTGGASGYEPAIGH